MIRKLSLSTAFAILVLIVAGSPDAAGQPPPKAGVTVTDYTAVYYELSNCIDVHGSVTLPTPTRAGSIWSVDIVFDDDTEYDFSTLQQTPQAPYQEFMPWDAAGTFYWHTVVWMGVFNQMTQQYYPGMIPVGSYTFKARLIFGNATDGFVTLYSTPFTVDVYDD